MFCGGAEFRFRLLRTFARLFENVWGPSDSSLAFAFPFGFVELGRFNDHLKFLVGLAEPFIPWNASAVPFSRGNTRFDFELGESLLFPVLGSGF